MNQPASPLSDISRQVTRSRRGGLRRRATLSLAALTLLAACGGGEGGDSAARTGVTIKEQLSSSALALAPGETVTYTVVCNGSGALRYQWDAGDGRNQVSSSEPTFSTTYSLAGKYLPRVTCIDARGGRAASTADVYQHVAVPAHTVSAVRAVPVVNAASEFHLSVSCVGSQSDSTLSYHWDFGDGDSRSSTGANVTHRYPSSPAMQYTARVRCEEAITLNRNSGGTVQTSWGVQGSTTVVVDSAGKAPTLSSPLSVNPYIPTTAGPTTFSMECAATNGGTVQYSFDFGDGSPLASNSTGRVEHTYAPKGQVLAMPYAVKAMCQQGGGWSQVQELRVGVRVPQLSLLAGKVLDPATSLDVPIGVAIDGHGNVYVADREAHAIRKISPSGMVSTLAGGSQGFTDGAGVSASFNSPTGVAVDSSGHVYVTDMNNHAIRKISPSGAVTTLAGSGAEGFAEGAGAVAAFRFPQGIAVDRSNQVYVADSGNHAIRKINLAGVVSTLAGGTRGFADGNSSTASFHDPLGVAVDSGGQVYVADFGNHAIRKISSTGAVSTLVNGGLSLISGVAVDGIGQVYATDSETNAIYRISASGAVSRLAGVGLEGLVDGEGLSAQFYSPTGLAVDNSGQVHVADTLNHAIRKISPAGVVSTLAKRDTDGSSDGAGSAARFTRPNGVAVDQTGQVYVADTGNSHIRKISLGGMVSTLAKDGLASYAPVTGPFTPRGVAVNREGQVYAADEGGVAILKISPPEIVSTLAGGARAGFADGASASASFWLPTDVALDSSGHVHVADTGNHAIRKISPSGEVTTLAGNGTAGFADGSGTVARFRLPQGVAVGRGGEVYVADTDNHAIRKISLSGEVSTMAGSGAAGFANGTGSAASFNRPMAVAVDSQSNVYVADTQNSAIRKITPQGLVSTVAGVPLGDNLREGALPSSIGKPMGLAISGRRLVFSAGNYIAQIDFTP